MQDFESITHRGLPETRYMGSKRKILSSLHQIFQQLTFKKALDGFSGSSSVSYLLKLMGKEVTSVDYLQMNTILARALVVNQGEHLLTQNMIDEVTRFKKKPSQTFISDTFQGLYFDQEESLWLDQMSASIKAIVNSETAALVKSALVRACLKKRPRGIFTYTGVRYQDGRKDLEKSLEVHLREAIDHYQGLVFHSPFACRAFHQDILSFKENDFDLVYFDPPYFSEKSDNEYARRYHFVEGLVSYWQDVEIDHSSKTKKIVSPDTAFSSKKRFLPALLELFDRHRNSQIVLSYSSQSWPSAEQIRALLKEVGKSVDLVEIDYQYSIGTHQHKKNNRNNQVKEYLFVGL